MTILLTGFEPFGGETINPAWEAVQQLHGCSIAGHEVVAMQLPCVFGKSISALAAHIAAVKPQLVLCVGQAGGRADISVERIAINVDDARIPDNLGQQPIDETISRDGPAAYFSTLPIKAVVASLREAGIPASVSQTAGTYVCNHVFYGLQHLLAKHAPTIRSGFIHIPYLPQQAAAHPNTPSMALESIVAALKISLSTCLSTTHDLKIGGGEIS